MCKKQVHLKQICMTGKQHRKQMLCVYGCYKCNPPQMKWQTHKQMDTAVVYNSIICWQQLKSAVQGTASISAYRIRTQTKSDHLQQSYRQKTDFTTYSCLTLRLFNLQNAPGQ